MITIPFEAESVHEANYVTTCVANLTGYRTLLIADVSGYQLEIPAACFGQVQVFLLGYCRAKYWPALRADLGVTRAALDALPRAQPVTREETVQTQTGERGRV